MSPRTKSQVQEMLTEQMVNEIPTIGYFVFYELGEFTVTFEDLKREITNAGLDGDRFPEPSRKKAYHHAVQAFRVEDYRVLARKVATKRSNENYRHQITVEEEKEVARRGHGVLSYSAEAWVALDDAGNLVCEGDAKLKSRLTEHINSYMKNVQREVVRDWISYEIKRWNAVNARSTGGLWFVAPTYKEQLESMGRVLATINSQWMVHPVFDTDTWRTNAAGFVENDLMTEFRKFERMLDDDLDVAKHNGGEIKRFKLDTHLKRLAELKDKASVYEPVLDHICQELRDSTAAVEKKVNNIITGKTKGFTPMINAVDQRKKDRAERVAARAEEKERKAQESKAAQEEKDAKRKAAAAAIAKAKAAAQPKRSKKTVKKSTRKSPF